MQIEKITREDGSYVLVDRENLGLVVWDTKMNSQIFEFVAKELGYRLEKNEASVR